ncbi:MAG: hypothetical protein PVH84_12940 [Candidatus Aminicenantes bacterium]|jgi:hypothetical protein
MAQKIGLDRRSAYYRTIEKLFIDLRGAPFLLSSKELYIIKQWEEGGIPLRVVLEGIRRSFERSRPQQGKRRISLDYCHPNVMRAFAQYKNRRVGQKREKAMGEKSRNPELLLEVERFLTDIPEELCALRPIFSSLQKKLSSGKATEEELEMAEETVEGLIEESVTSAERKKITEKMRSEFGSLTGAKFDQVFRIMAVKQKREKHKIPHVSPFYY